MKDTEGRTVIDRVNEHIEKEADRLLRKFCEELDTRGLTKEAQEAIQEKLDNVIIQGNIACQLGQAVREDVKDLSAEVRNLGQTVSNGVNLLRAELNKTKGVYMTCNCSMVTFIEYKPDEMLWDGGTEEGARFLWHCSTCNSYNQGPDDILRHWPVARPMIACLICHVG